MATVGIDSVLMTQSFPRFLGTSLRKGLLGVGIEVKDEKRFNKAYSSILNKLFTKYGIIQRLPVYNGHSIGKELGTETVNREDEFLNEFKELILPEIEGVHFFYTFIFGLQTPDVSIYGATVHNTKIPLLSANKGVQDFYDLISHSYPMLCAWELTESGNKSFIKTDHFQGRVSPAWLSIANNKNIEVYYKGDQCSPIISTADILLKYLKLKMLNNANCYLKEEIEKLSELFPEKFKLYFMGKKCLKSMVPHHTSQIDTSRFSKHPIVYLIKEDPKSEDEDTIIDKSPLFKEVVEKSYANDGCFKYFHSEDAKNIIKGDELAIFGERGKTIFEKLKGLKYPVKKFNATS